MGPLIKYTNRLILRVENESKAKQVLDLYLRNRLPFEQYEPTRQIGRASCRERV